MAMGRRRTTALDLPPRMHRKGNVYWHVSTTLPRKWTRLGDNLSLARLKWAEIENGTGERVFSALANKYLEECQDGLAENTRKSHVHSAKYLCAVFGNMPVESIEPQHVATYLDTHPSKTSANKHIACLAVMFEKAMRWGWVKSNPTRGIDRNKQKPRDRYLTDDEYRALWHAAPEQIRAMMDIGYLTSLRLSDILKLHLSDITPEGLYVQQKKTGKKQLYEMTPDLQAAIDAAKAAQVVSSLLLFTVRGGKPLTMGSFQGKWARLKTEVGAEDVHFHDIRAKSATDAKRAGLDYQALLGHTTRTMSDRYVKRFEVEVVKPNVKMTK